MSEHRKALLLIVILSSLAVTASGGTARAQELTPQQKQEVHDLSLKAKEISGLGDYAGALELMGKALAISPNDPTLIYGMGYLLELNKDYEGALDLFRTCTAPRIDKAIRVRARQGLTRLEPILHLGKVSLKMEPATATVRVNGLFVEPDDGTLYLKQGEYQIQARYEGCRTQVQTAVVFEGRITPLVFKLLKVNESGQTDGAIVPCLESPRPPVSTSNGTVTFTELPTNARIKVDGVAYASVSNGVLTIPLGDHLIEVEAEGYEPRTFNVNVAMDKPLELRTTWVRLEPRELVARAPVTGKVIFDIVPKGAEIIIGNDVYTPGPDGSVELPVGEYFIELRAEQHETTSLTVDVVEGPPIKIARALRVQVPSVTPTAPPPNPRSIPEAAPVAVTFQLRPATAVVRVNGIVQAPRAGVVMLAPGKHRVEVSAEGFNGANFELDIKPGGDTIVEVDLTPNPPPLLPQVPAPTPPEALVVAFKLQPASSTIRIDGTEMRTKAGKLTLDPGTHQVELSAEGYQTEAFVLELKSGDRPPDVIRSLKKVAPPPKPGLVSFKVSPRTATITIDGESARLTDGKVELAEGDYLVEIAAEGHETESFSLHVAAGKASSVSRVLKPTRQPDKQPALVELRLDVSPSDTRIRIDGAIHTPGPGGKSSLLPGVHLVELDAEGYERESFNINVVAGTPLAIERRLVRVTPKGPTPVSVTLRVTPRTTAIKIDGGPHTPGPGGKVALLPGDHLVELSAEGHIPESFTITVLEGRPTTVTKALKAIPPPAKPVPVQFRLSPTDAVVRVDGKPVAPDAAGKIALVPGKYKVELESKGHLPQSFEIEVVDKRPLTIEKSLNRDPAYVAPPVPAAPPAREPVLVPVTVGKVFMKVSPVEAEVVIDKQIMALEPDKGITLPAGEHEFEVRAKGFKSKTLKVMVLPGKSEIINLTLQPKK